MKKSCVSALAHRQVLQKWTIHTIFRSSFFPENVTTLKIHVSNRFKRRPNFVALLFRSLSLSLFNNINFSSFRNERREKKLMRLSLITASKREALAPIYILRFRKYIYMSYKPRDADTSDESELGEKFNEIIFVSKTWNPYKFKSQSPCQFGKNRLFPSHDAFFPFAWWIINFSRFKSVRKATVVGAVAIWNLIEVDYVLILTLSKWIKTFSEIISAHATVRVRKNARFLWRLFFVVVYSVVQFSVIIKF